MRTSAGYESVSKEALALRAVELLRFLLCYIAILIACREYMLHDLCLKRRACPSKVIEIDIEPVIDRLMDLMVVIAELTGSHTFLQSSCLACSSVLISSADIERLIATGAAEACKDIRRENLRKIPEMRDVVHIWQCRGNQSFLHIANIPI